MKVHTLDLAAGAQATINNIRPHNSLYRVTFAGGAGVIFTVTAGSGFEIISNGLPVVIDIDDDIPAGITAL
jgi:hypothetical protein